METAIKKVELQNGSAILPRQDFTPDQIELIKNLYCKGSTNDEFKMFLYVCQSVRLNPLLKHIHAVKRYDSTLKRQVMSIQTGIDGYRLIAERTKRYSPGREPTYQYDQNGKVISATAYVKKRTDDGQWHEVAATAFFDEYVQKTKEGNPTHFWMKFAHNQLAKCAESLALRKAFPADLSGVYTDDEMHQADNNDIEVAVEKISQAQYEELSDIFSQCDPAYAGKVMNFLRKQKPMAVNNLIDLPLSLYERVKAGAIKNREEHVKPLQEETISEDEQPETWGYDEQAASY